MHNDAAAGYRTFLVDLFGVMAYGELSAFERLSADARFSPTLRDRSDLGRLATVEFGHYELISERLTQLGVEAEAAMRPFQPTIDAFHDRTRPGDWYESLMKAYVLDAISADFYRAVAAYLDEDTRTLVAHIQGTEPQFQLLLTRLQQALAEDPRLSSRLALWGRRLVGEALTQAQRISGERAFLAGIMNDAGTGGGVDRGTAETGMVGPSTVDRGAAGPGGGGSAGAGRADPGTADSSAELTRLFAGLTRAHSRRMNLLGLTA